MTDGSKEELQKRQLGRSDQRLDRVKEETTSLVEDILEA